MKAILRPNFATQLAATPSQLISMATSLFVVHENIAQASDHNDPHFVYRNNHTAGTANHAVVPLQSPGLPFLHIVAAGAPAGQLSGNVSFKAYGFFPEERGAHWADDSSGQRKPSAYPPHALDDRFPDVTSATQLGGARPGGPTHGGFFRPLFNPVDGTFEQTIALTTPKIVADSDPSGPGDFLSFDMYDDNKFVGVDGASIVLVLISAAGSGGSGAGVLLGHFKG